MRSLFAVLMIFSSWAYACQPCRKEIGLNETIDKSDLIVVIEYEIPQKTTADNQRNNVMSSDIRIEIKEVLKGSEKAKVISVDSWYGMCPYGLVIKPGSYIVFLKKNQKRYTTLDCAVESLILNDGSVTLDGKSITINEFRNRYGFL